MSKQTKQALDDAIRAHLADECDGMSVMQWAVVTWSIEPEHIGDGAGHYGVTVPNGQPHHATRGLLDEAQSIMNEAWSTNREEDV